MNSSSLRKQPIPPPSHPKQYRAIGLIKGKYQVTEAQQLNRGMLLTSNGTVIDAVLLGRTLGICKKHLDLEQEHLWVVYPRTQEEKDDLHVQIVGVWEPKKLTTTENPSATLAETEEKIQDGYFSIRGEVIFYSPGEKKAIVKIRQSPRKESEKAKFFKLKLQGTLPSKSVGHFWDLEVQLQGQTLVIQDGTDIGLLPPKKPFRQQRGTNYPRQGYRESNPSESTLIPKPKKTPGIKPALSRPVPKKTQE